MFKLVSFFTLILIHSECFRQRKIATVIRSREQHRSVDEKRVLLTRQEASICIPRLFRLEFA
jgi:hypothetical protein